MKNEIITLDEKTIRDRIVLLRGQKVLLDYDLAEIYGYSTKAFNQQVKNNIEKFDEDFMFQLTHDEYENLRSKFLTSSLESNYGGRRYMPYAFTEQGIYMLMTVLKGEMAIRQSKMLIRIFKAMKDYIEYNALPYAEQIMQLSLQTNENTKAIKRIEKTMVTKNELKSIMKSFTEKQIQKEFLIYNNQSVEADIAYQEIYKLAKKSIYIIDNYISLKTLILLKETANKDIIIFSDNTGNHLRLDEYDDFKNEYPNTNIDFINTNDIIHDRYIILDYKKKSERIYHCGASSKDAGKKVTTITEINDKEVFHPLIDSLLTNSKLILN